VIHNSVTNLIHFNFNRHFIVSLSSTCFGRQASIFSRHYTSSFWCELRALVAVDWLKVVGRLVYWAWGCGCRSGGLVGCGMPNKVFVKLKVYEVGYAIVIHNDTRSTKYQKCVVIITNHQASHFTIIFYFRALLSLWHNTSFSSQFSNTFRLRSLNVTDQVSHPHKTPVKTLLLYVLICLFGIVSRKITDSGSNVSSYFPNLNWP
jgi:hypothetical protein